jgi:hypothetical protein
MTHITTKAELISALKDSSQRTQDWFTMIPTVEFFTRHSEDWSASDNVDHLIKAIKPIVKAIGLPTLALHTMFGKPKNPSITYDEVCARYKAEIAKGARASGNFLPDQETPENPENKKTELISRLSRTVDRLISAIEKWEDKELDDAQLPHPILGNLTLREMLFFTHHHMLRHASLEGD